MSMKKLFLILLISFCFASTLARSAEFFVLPGTKTLLVMGETEEGDTSQIEKFVRDDKINLLIMKGPGGSLEEGKRIAAIVLKENLSITIPRNTNCASACAFIFTAGNIRIMKELFLELTKSLKDIVLQFISEVILLYKSFRN